MSSGALTANGVVTVHNSAVIDGNLSAANLTLSGNISAVAAAFSGNLSAAQVTVGSVIMGSSSITGLSAPSANSDAANKEYVDSVATGLDVKASVRAATTSNIVLSGAQTIDGVAVIAGDRVLVKNQTTASQNGIYVAAAGAWSRSADADQDAEVTAGMFTFVEEGTANADTGWVLSTDNPIVVGTTNLTFVQFSSAGVVLAGNGLQKIGNTISVLPKDETIGADGSGSYVKGVPAQFLLANVAVSSNVTAANFALLVDGIAQDAAALHSHSRSVTEFAAAGGIAAGQVAYISANNAVSKADALSVGDAKAWVAGVVVSVAGGKAEVVRDGVCAGALAALGSAPSAGDPIYLGSDGALISSISGLASGSRIIKMGIAMNASDLFVQISDYGKKA